MELRHFVRPTGGASYGPPSLLGKGMGPDVHLSNLWVSQFLPLKNSAQGNNGGGIC